MKNAIWLSLLVVAGCAAPTRKVWFESNPEGAEIFLQATTPGGEMTRSPNVYFWDPIGKTPFTWTLSEEDVDQRNFKAVAPVQGTNRTNLETIDLSVFRPDRSSSNIIFFDLTRP